MRRLSALVIVLAALCSGCTRQYSDFFPYNDDGSAKPAVAFVPVYDASGQKLPWNVSAELTQRIRSRTKTSGQIFLIPEEEMAPAIDKYQDRDMMKENISFFSQFKGCDYIIVSELVEHEERPFQRGRDVPLYLNGVYVDYPDAAVLDMKMHVKVIDIRTPGNPRVHLQEVVESSFVIPAGRKAENYKEKPWGSKDYEFTVMQKAHDTLVRKVKERIEQITFMAPG